MEDLKEKWKKGEEVDPATILSVEWLVAFGIAAEDAQTILDLLKEIKIKTLGNLLAVKTEEELIEYVGGDKISGTTIWNAIEAYKKKRAALDQGTSTSSLSRLLRLQSRTAGIPGFVVAETAQHKKVRLDSDELRHNRVFRLSQNLWGDAGRTTAVWLRPCYADLAKIVRCKMLQPKGDVLIAGSRGTGKSVFGFLMALELLDSGKIVLYEHKQTKMLVIGSNPDADQLEALAPLCREYGYDSPTGEGVYLIRTGDKDLWEQLTWAAALTHVQDLGEDPDAKVTRNGNGRKLILTSPNNMQLSQLHSEHELLKLFMPRWDLDELRQARLSCFPDVKEEVMIEMFETYGGIVRFVLEQDPSDVERSVKQAMNNLTIEDLASIFRTADYFNLPPQRSTGYFIHVVPKIEETGKSLGNPEVDALVRKYGHFKCVFATEIIQKDLVQRFISDQKFSVQKFASAVESISEIKTWYGYMLEAYAHKALPRGGNKRMKTSVDIPPFLSGIFQS